jgi:GH25 family lysozyme M1 (1,4-beta-N-acetylmuramidase)
VKRGIDISKWNQVTDYDAVKNAGVEFAIVKVINSNDAPESMFATHMDGLKKAGISCSMGYTYTYANTIAKAAKSAVAFAKTAKPAGINYMWLDIEDDCMRGLGHGLIDIISVYRSIALIAEMQFGIYTYNAFYNAYIKNYVAEVLDIPFWIARYPNLAVKKITDTPPEAKNLPKNIKISGWQYSSKGTIPGISGYTDLNIWYDDIIDII